MEKNDDFLEKCAKIVAKSSDPNKLLKQFSEKEKEVILEMTKEYSRAMDDDKKITIEEYAEVIEKHPENIEIFKKQFSPEEFEAIQKVIEEKNKKIL